MTRITRNRHVLSWLCIFLLKTICNELISDVYKSTAICGSPEIQLVISTAGTSIPRVLPYLHWYCDQGHELLWGIVSNQATRISLKTHPHTKIGSMWWRYFLWCHCCNDFMWLPGRQYISEIELRSIGNAVVSTYCLRVFKDPDPYIFHGICTGMFSRRPFVRLCYVFMVTFVLEDTIANNEKSRYTRWRFLPVCQVKKKQYHDVCPHAYIFVDITMIWLIRDILDRDQISLNTQAKIKNGALVGHNISTWLDSCFSIVALETRIAGWLVIVEVPFQY